VGFVVVCLVNFLIIAGLEYVLNARRILSRSWVWKSIVLAVILNVLYGARFVLVVEFLFVGDAWTMMEREDAGNVGLEV
jgi:uncharacterized membrane protein